MTIARGTVRARKFVAACLLAPSFLTLFGIVDARSAEIDPSSSNLRFSGSGEFSEYPSELWSESFTGEQCQYGYWSGKTLTAEVAYCRITDQNYVYVPEKMVLSERVPDTFSYVDEHRSSVMWSNSDTLYGDQGQVSVRYFTLFDVFDHSCVGFETIWGRNQWSTNKIVIGYFCSESATYPWEQVLARELHLLSIDGELESIVSAP